MGSIAIRTAVIALALGPSIAGRSSWAQRPVPKGPPPATRPDVAIEGTVSYSGPLPKPVAVPFADAERLPMEVDPKSGALKDAALWLEGAPAAAPGPPGPVVRRETTRRPDGEEMLGSEEKHLHWLEEQLTLIDQVGEGHYLAQQMK